MRNTRKNKNSRVQAQRNNIQPLGEKNRAKRPHRTKRKPQEIGVQPKNHTKSYSTTGRILSGIIFVMAVLYLCGYTLSFLNREKVAFEVVGSGHIDSANTVDAVIVRNEAVYKSAADGVVYYTVSDNEKVKKGAVVCSVRDEETAAEIETSLDTINKDIYDKQKARGELSLFSEDIERINNEIKSLTDAGMINLSASSLSAMYDLRAQIQKKIDTRNQMILSEDKGIVAGLVSEKQSIQNELSKSTETITAKDSGIVSFSVDGMEALFDIAGLDNITAEDVKKPLNDYKRETNELFKIVASNDWYIIAAAPNKYVSKIAAAETARIYIKTEGLDKELEVSVQRMEQGDKETLLVLKSSKNLIDFIDERSIRFEFSKPLEGYKIPNSAIIEQTLIKIPGEYVANGTVIKVTENGTSNIQINEAERDADGSIYVSLNRSVIKLGDTLQNPLNAADLYILENVKNTVGVFIVNSGVAEFKSINTSNMEQNNTHTVLDTSVNPNLMLYDRIVTDAKKVEKGQIVFY